MQPSGVAETQPQPPLSDPTFLDERELCADPDLFRGPPLPEYNGAERLCPGADGCGRFTQTQDRDYESNEKSDSYGYAGIPSKVEAPQRTGFNPALFYRFRHLQAVFASTHRVTCRLRLRTTPPPRPVRTRPPPTDYCRRATPNSHRPFGPLQGLFHRGSDARARARGIRGTHIKNAAKKAAKKAAWDAKAAKKAQEKEAKQRRGEEVRADHARSSRP